MAFTHYNTIPSVVKLTPKEKWAALSVQNRTQITNEFRKTEVNKSKNAARKLVFDDDVVEYGFKKYQEIESKCTEIMREEILLEEAVVDPETGEIITPAVYNTSPTNSAGLRADVLPYFTEEFSTGQIQSLVSFIIKDSKTTGNGVWAYYSTEVKK